MNKKSNLKNIYYFIIFFVILSCSKNKEKINPNETSVDSISLFLKLSENDSFPIKKRIAYSDKSLSIIKGQKNDTIKRFNLSRLISNYSKMNEWSKYKISNKLFLESALSDNDTLQIAIAYSQAGHYYFNSNINDSAFYFYLKSEKLLKKVNNKKILLEVYIKKATIQFYNDDYLGAELSATGALKIARELNNPLKEYYSLNLLGVISNEFTNYNKAIEYHNKALKVTETNKFPQQDHLETFTLNNIGYTYQNLGNNEKAIIYFNKALNDNKLQTDNPSLYATLIDNLAYSNFKLNNFKKLPSLFYLSLKIRDSLKLSSKIIYSKIHLSEYYSKIKDQNSAKNIAIEALMNARSNGYSGDVLLALKQISKVDIVNSAKYSNEYIKINDSLQTAERNSKDKFARIAFETDEISQENTQLEERNRKLLFFFVVSAILLGFLFIIRTQRAKTRELVLKQAQQKANEDIYNLMIAQQTVIDESRAAEKKRIARELHDGVLGRMFGARLNLDSLNSSSDDESVQKRFNYLSELKNIEQDLREISHDLNREKTVLINNFVSIVNNLLEEQKASFDAKVVCVVDDTIKWDKIHNTIKINLYRILQEGLQNINKYANAKNIKVEIKGDGENVYLIVEDDGAGFEVNKKSKGIGLQNMISRTNECHGIFDIKSEKGKGTSIEISVPYENNKITTEKE